MSVTESLPTIAGSAKRRSLIIPEKLRPVVGAAVFFVIMMIIFIIASPKVFLDVGIFSAVFLALPAAIILGLGLVFVTVSGESDLSFPSIVPLCGLTYSVTFTALDQNFFVAVLAAVVVGIVCGWLNGFLVTRLGLSSLITTLGMNFALVGLTHVLNRGEIRSSSSSASAVQSLR